MTKKFIPAVSIIIPMYNTEKYIGECLDSILAQTFTDFEIIVVDHASTDNSAAIVEKYESVRLVKLKSNSGTPAFPRNIGVNLSRGEYIMFVDADDAITKTALEELYTPAKKFDADVVACDNYYSMDENGLTTFEPVTYINNSKIRREMTFLVEDLESRLLYFHDLKIFWNPWNKLIRRDLIVENNLKMVGAFAEDVIFTCCLLCVAKKYLCVPNVIYFYRQVDTSITHKGMTMAASVQRSISTAAEALNYVDSFMDNLNLDIKLKYIAFETLIREIMRHMTPIYSLMPAPVLDEFVRAELEKIENPRVLTAFLFSRMNVFNVKIIRQQQQIQQLEKLKT